MKISKTQLTVIIKEELNRVMILEEGKQYKKIYGTIDESLIGDLAKKYGVQKKIVSAILAASVGAGAFAPKTAAAQDLVQSSSEFTQQSSLQNVEKLQTMASSVTKKMFQSFRKTKAAAQNFDFSVNKVEVDRRDSGDGLGNHVIFQVDVGPHLKQAFLDNPDKLLEWWRQEANETLPKGMQIGSMGNGPSYSIRVGLKVDKDLASLGLGRIFDRVQ